MRNSPRAFAVLLIASGAGCASAPASVVTPAAIPAVAGTPRDLGSLRVIDVALGDGPMVAPRRCLYTHYTGWLADGTKFDSSRDTTRSGVPGEPVGFAQGGKQVIDAWDVGFEGMRVGGIRRMFVPWRMGYGARGNPPVIPQRADLVFDVTLMAIADTLPHRSGVKASCPDWRVARLQR